jgi:hypothetical protein
MSEPLIPVTVRWESLGWQPAPRGAFPHPVPSPDDPSWPLMVETAICRITSHPPQTWIAPLGTPNPPPQGVYPASGDDAGAWRRVA